MGISPEKVPTKQKVTVTHDGRTVVDANALFETEEVKRFLSSLKRIQDNKLLRRRSLARLKPLPQM